MTSCVILHYGQADPVPTVGDGALDVPSFAFCIFIPFVILRRAEESALVRKNKIGAYRSKILRALPSRMTSCVILQNGQADPVPTVGEGLALPLLFGAYCPFMGQS